MEEVKKEKTRRSPFVNPTEYKPVDEKEREIKQIADKLRLDDATKAVSDKDFHEALELVQKNQPIREVTEKLHNITDGALLLQVYKDLKKIAGLRKPEE